MNHPGKAKILLGFRQQAGGQNLPPANSLLNLSPQGQQWKQPDVDGQDALRTQLLRPSLCLWVLEWDFQVLFKTHIHMNFAWVQSSLYMRSLEETKNQFQEKISTLSIPQLSCSAAMRMQSPAPAAPLPAEPAKGKRQAQGPRRYLGWMNPCPAS